MVPMEVSTQFDDEEHAILGADCESRFFTCPVCGDNWLSVKETEPSGECRVTFVHQMGTDPELKRVALMQTPVLVQDNTVEEWQYFLDDQHIDEDIWFDKLQERRKVLKSVCSN